MAYASLGDNTSRAENDDSMMFISFLSVHVTFVCFFSLDFERNIGRIVYILFEKYFDHR